MAKRRVKRKAKKEDLEPPNKQSALPSLQTKPFKPKQQWLARLRDKETGNKDTATDTVQMLANDTVQTSGSVIREGPSVIQHTNSQITALVTHFSPANHVDAKLWRKAIVVASLAYHEALSGKTTFWTDTLDGTETIDELDLNRRLMLMFTSRWAGLRKRFHPKLQTGGRK